MVSHLNELSKEKSESMADPVRFQLLQVKLSLLSDLQVGSQNFHEDGRLLSHITYDRYSRGLHNLLLFSLDY